MAFRVFRCGECGHLMRWRGEHCGLCGAPKSSFQRPGILMIFGAGAAVAAWLAVAGA